jgi:cell division septal protein FtsQ
LKIGAPVAVIVGIIFLLRADFLQVKNLAVIGTQEVSQTQIKIAVQNYLAGNKFFVIPKSNIFFINKNQLAGVLLSDFTRIEKVNINKQFFDKGIEFNISERSSDFLWCNSECYFMTKNGLVFQSQPTLASRDKIIFTGILQGDPLMKNFATSEQMQKYLKFIDAFKNAQIEIISINVESEDKATVKTNIGDIIFNPQDSDIVISAQNAIVLVNNLKAKNPSIRFNYIDTRFGNKMFYKLF